MKKNFISPLFCLALVLVLPLQGQGKMAFDEYVKPSRNSTKRSSYDNELIRFVEQLSILDEDESSPLRKLNDLIKRGDSVVSKDDFVAALDHAQSVIAEYNDLIPDEQIEQISDAFNALIDVVEQESDSDTRDCSSPCDDSALKIKKILCVLNKAIFCGLVAFRDEVLFCKHVEMKDSLSVNKLRAHKAKIDQLEAKKAEFDKLKAKKAKIKNLEIDEIETCDLIVNCNIYMQDSTSPAIGNIYKGGDRFLHNFGTNNTFVGENAGNFTSAGSDNTGLGYHALLNNQDVQLVAVGSGALENYQLSADPTFSAQSVAVGYHALNANVDGNSNTAVGWSALESDVTGSATGLFGNNTAVGWAALQFNTIGINNTALGNAAMNSNTSGNDNTAIGSTALAFNLTGTGNTALGVVALRDNTTGIQNTAVGNRALRTNTTGDDNIAIGHRALFTANESQLVAVGSGAMENYTVSSDPTAPAQSVAVGFHALNANVSGTSNTAVGWMALASDVTDALTTFGDNTAVGWSALTSNTIGAENTALGNSAMNINTTGINNTAAGSGAMQGTGTGTGSNNTGLGRSALFAIDSGNANTAVGRRALGFITTGDDSTAVGHQALRNANEPQLVAVGSGAMENYIVSSDPTVPAQSVAVGYHALNANVSGTSNTAVGWMALASDVTDALTTFGDNTAVGWGALQFNTIGAENTALGNSSMNTNTIGVNNTAAGSAAMQGTGTGTGSNNTGLGRSALFSIDSGNENTAVGRRTLGSITSGSNNVAVGAWTVVGTLDTGSNNTALGFDAGSALTLNDNNNIDIGNVGVAGDVATIRIGTVGTHVANFQAGIFGAGPIVGASVLVDAAGQLGTVPSSIRYKENVQNMNEASSAILKLRPVMFNYKADASHAQQYGLVAEEVYDVMPALVLRDGNGQIETVKYHELASLLLNELIKMNARLAILEEQVN